MACLYTLAHSLSTYIRRQPCRSSLRLSKMAAADKTHAFHIRIDTHTKRMYKLKTENVNTFFKCFGEYLNRGKQIKRKRNPYADMYTCTHAHTNYVYVMYCIHSGTTTATTTKRNNGGDDKRHDITEGWCNDVTRTRAWRHRFESIQKWCHQLGECDEMMSQADRWVVTMLSSLLYIWRIPTRLMTYSLDDVHAINTCANE